MAKGDKTAPAVKEPEELAPTEEQTQLAKVEGEIPSVKMRELDVHYQRNRVSQMLTMAKQFHSAGCFTSDVQNAQQAFVKLQTGMEMGMGPMESMQSLYIVKGKVTLWGSALSKRIKEHGWKIDYEDSSESEVTKVTVTKGEEIYTEEVDGSTDKVLQSSTAYKFAPRDKRRWHCLGRLVRFHIPEVLGGPINYIQEELFEEEPEMAKIETPEPVVEIETGERPSLEQFEKETEKEMKDSDEEAGVTKTSTEEEKAKEVIEENSTPSAAPSPQAELGY